MENKWNVTDLLRHEWLIYNAEKNIPHVVVLCLFLAVGLVGNSMVIYVYVFKMKRYREDRFFIPALAVADLLACTVTCLYHSIKTLLIQPLYSDILCKLPLFLMWSTSTASAMLLLLIAIHRFVKVKQHPGNKLSPRIKKGAVILTVFVSVLINMPVLYFAGVGEFETSYRNRNITVTTCMTANSGHSALENAYLIFICIVAVGNIIATTGIYTPIACIIYKISRENKKKEQFRSRTFSIITEFSASDVSDKKYNGPPELEKIKIKRQDSTAANRTNFNTMFLILVLVYAISYFPSFIMTFLSKGDPNFYHRMTPASSNVSLTLQRLFIVNHIVNPIVYGYFDLTFRNKLRKMFC